MAASNATTGGTLENHLLALLAPMLRTFTPDATFATPGLLHAIEVRNFNGTDDFRELAARFTQRPSTGLLAIPNPDYQANTETPGSQLCKVEKTLSYMFLAGTGEASNQDKLRDFCYTTQERFEEVLHGRDISATLAAANVVLPRGFVAEHVVFGRAAVLEEPNLFVWGQEFTLLLRGHVRRHC